MPNILKNGGLLFTVTPAIEFKNICKQFGAVKANDHLSFSVAKGSIHGIVGENGAGYRVRTLGLNPHAAHYAGISIQRTIIGVMAGSGALAGMAAVNSEMGSSHHLGLNFTAGAGFIGIAVALMGRNHPVGILLSALLFGGLIQGGFDLSLEKPGIAPETFIFIQGLIILYCGAMENLYAPALAALLKRAEPDSKGLA